MKQSLGLMAILLLLAFTPQMTNLPNAKITVTSTHPFWVVRTFHDQRDGSDGHTYYVTLDFNLATQAFGVITAHDILTPSTELSVTRNSGSATTLNGNGSTIEVTQSLGLTIDGTSTTITIPTGTYPFD